MKINLDTEEVTFRKYALNDLEAILELQDKTFDELQNPAILRKNSKEMFMSCLKPPHYTLGVFLQNKLIALAILYFPGSGDENLSNIIDSKICDFAANFKLVIVDSEYRGNGLQNRLSQQLEDYAKQSGIKLLCATISPNNKYSRINFEKNGYKYFTQIKKYGGLLRDLYYKYI